MKKVLLLAFSGLLVLSACKKDDNKPAPGNEGNGNNNPQPPKEIVVKEVNTGLVNKFTGSLCGPCGSWGWQAFDQIMTENGSNAIYMGTYSQNFVAQLFITQAATDMDASWQSEGYPTFAANGVCQVDRSTNVNIASEISKVKKVIDNHKAAAVVANTGYRTKIEGDSMTIETKTKFFADASGEFYVSVFLVEDSVIGYQYGNPDGNNTAHHHVLRGAAKLDGTATPVTFGYLIGKGDITAGTTVENKYKISVKGYRQDKLQVVAIIWNKIGVRYKFVNACGEE